jgi:hypothetical protein
LVDQLVDGARLQRAVRVVGRLSEYRMLSPKERAGSFLVSRVDIFRNLTQVSSHLGRVDGRRVAPVAPGVQIAQPEFFRQAESALPEAHKSENVAAEKRFAERIPRPADGVIADSENAPQDAIRILDLSPRKVPCDRRGSPAFASEGRQYRVPEAP